MALPASVYVELRWDVVGEYITGGWCDSCALPSVIEVDLMLSNHATLAPIARYRFQWCTDCHRHQYGPPRKV